MADFGNAVITNAGAQLLASVMSGSKKIEFTALTVGDGSYSDSEKEMSALQQKVALKNQRLSFSFNSVTPYSNTAVRLRAIVSNITVTDGFYINEIGIWAKDASDSSAEPVLYSLVVANTADFLPAYNGTTPSTIEQEWYTTLSNTASATITVDSSAYVGLSDFEDFKSNILNIIGPQETSTIASQAYEVDEFFIYANTLYKVIVAINAGDEIVVGTNIEATTVANELKNGGGMKGSLATEEEVETLAEDLMSNAEELYRVAEDTDITNTIENLDDI